MWNRISISLFIFPNIPWKSHVSTIFSQKSIFAYSLCVLSVIVNISKISRARLHNGLKMDNILESMERGDP